MTRATKYVYGVAFILIVSTMFGFFLTRTYSTEVPKGFAYGDPKSQTVISASGTYTDKEYGFPATYREVESFHPSNGSFASSSFERHNRKSFFIVVNIVFWTCLLTVLFWPFVLLVGKARKRNGVTVTEERKPSQVKKP